MVEQTVDLEGVRLTIDDDNQVIFVKYLGWTNTKPRRIKAILGSGAKSITRGVDFYDDGVDGSRELALELARSVKWLTRPGSVMVKGRSDDMDIFTCIDITAKLQEA